MARCPKDVGGIHKWYSHYWKDELRREAGYNYKCRLCGVEHDDASEGIIDIPLIIGYHPMRKEKL